MFSGNQRGEGDIKGGKNGDGGSEKQGEKGIKWPGKSVCTLVSNEGGHTVLEGTLAR